MDLGLEFLFTAVYAANCPEHRRSLWRDLINLSVDLPDFLGLGSSRVIKTELDNMPIRGVIIITTCPQTYRAVMDEFNACIHHAGLDEPGRWQFHMKQQ